MEAEGKVGRGKNTWDKANVISKLLFFYMLPVFRQNYRNSLKESDLCETSKVYQSKLLGDKMEQVWEHTKHQSLSLHRTFLKLFGYELAIAGLLQLLRALMMVTAEPRAIGGLVSYFNNKSGVTKNEAFFYAGLIIVNMLINLALSAHSDLAIMSMSMKFRVSCSSLIYRKCLKLNQTILVQTTVGQIINLLSKDASTFDLGFMLCHYVWIAPIQTMLGTYLLYRIMGLSAFAGVFLLVLFIPFQGYLGKLTAGVRLKTVCRTDARVQLLNEILNAVQVIKMYCWEKPFSKLISSARRQEVDGLRKNAYIEAITYSLDAILVKTAVFVTIVTFLFSGNDMAADKIYAMMIIYDGLRQTITHKFPFGITSLSELHVAMSRIHKFLTLEDLSQPSRNVSKDPRIFLEHVSAQWLPNSPALRNINISVSYNKLIAVVGQVGSGKTNLLNLILQELPLLEGSINVEGTISYASQETWLFSASVRQNILFGEPYVEDRYRNIIKICALETDLASLPYGDRTMVGEKGKKLSGGQKARINLARCIYKDADIYLLDDPLSAVDAKVGRQLYQECITKFLSNKIRVLVTHQLQYLQNAEEILIIKDGTIAGKGTFNELRTSGLNFAKLLRDSQSDNLHHEHDKEEILHWETNVCEKDKTVKEIIKAESISSLSYAEYFKAGGSYLTIALVLIVFAARQSVGNFGDYQLSQWVNAKQYANENNITIDGRIYSYTVNTLSLIVLSVVQTLFFFMFFTRASINLHDLTYAKISSATMRFFNSNLTGGILNRFSKDLNVVDELIPYIIYDFVHFVLQVVGIIILTSTANRWFVLPAAILFVLFNFHRKIYLATSTNVKRLEGIVRTPITSHLTASISGLTTIRAFSAQQTLTKEFDNHQDLHSAAWFLYISSSRAFKFWLDFTCAIVVSAVIISLLFSKDYYGGEAGLILTQYLGLSGAFQWGVRVSSSLENNMTSVERLLEYMEIETEPIRKSLLSLPKKWPKLGKIVFENVTMKYNSKEAPVLKSLNFTIRPKEKVGIVGRTGAGKSSLISALFQLYNIEGCIIIDDVDITKLPLEELRSKISIIPQDPVLFSGSIRKNLDPFDEHSNEKLWNALEQVELQDVILEMSDGLSSNVAEGGSNFSIGQRQLLCLARAITRNNQILVMDEATANVDPYTDSLIQKTIREKFFDCTVITIAHRLHTIMDSDRVLVMEAGKVVEFGRPHDLLQTTNGVFYTIVQATGKTVAEGLYNIAKNNCEKLQDS